MPYDKSFDTFLMRPDRKSKGARRRAMPSASPRTLEPPLDPGPDTLAGLARRLGLPARELMQAGPLAGCVRASLLMEGVDPSRSRLTGPA
jgi:hypothetical protein